MNSKADRLTLRQEQILRLLTRFRYLTTSTIKSELNLKTLSNLQYSIKKLMEQKYIDRKYDGKYKLQGKEALYFIRSKGFKYISTLDNKDFSEQDIKRLYNNKKVSESHARKLDKLVSIRNQLMKRYKEHDPVVLTDNELLKYPFYSTLKFDLGMNFSDGSVYFICYVALFQKMPVIYKSISKYIKFTQETKLEELGLENTKILVICESDNSTKKVTKAVARLLNSSRSNTKVYLTSVSKLTEESDEIWINAKVPSAIYSLLEDN